MSQHKHFVGPKHDTGWGMHFGLDVRDDMLAAHVPKIAAMGASYIVFYVGDEIQAGKCAKAAWAFGILPIIRPKCKINGGTPNWEAFVKAVLDAGVPSAIIQVFNEWGDSREWNLARKLVAHAVTAQRRGLRARAFGNPTGALGAVASHPWLDGILSMIAGFNRDLAAQRWRSAAGRISAAGGFIGLQVMDPLDASAALSNLDPGVAEIVVALSHSYNSNHPDDYPYDALNQRDHPGANIMTDDTCALSWLEYAEWCKASLGFYPDVIVTEGGPFFQQSEDSRYPRTDDAIHAQMVVGIVEQFRSGVLANGVPLPDWMRAFCFWLWHDPDWDSWYVGTLGTRQLTIDRVSAIPAFTRKFSTDVPPVIVPPKPVQKSMLGMFIQSLGDVKPDAKTWLAKTRVRGLLSMDHNPTAWRDILSVSPKTKVIGRMADEGGIDFNVADPEAAADAYFDRLLPLMLAMQGLYWAWMGPNEPVVQNVDAARKLSLFYVRLAKRVHDAGFRLVFGSFSEGNPPDLKLWTELLPAIRACHWLIALHEYDAPTMDTSTPESRCFRYRAMLRILPAEDAALVQLFILECGIDFMVDHRQDLGLPQLRKGYLHAGDIHNYLNEHNLGWYDQGLKADAQELHGGAGVVMATPFAAAWDIESTFNLGGQTAYDDVVAPGEPPDLLTPSPIVQPPQPAHGWCAFANRRPINAENFGVGRSGRHVIAVVEHIAVGAMAGIFPTFNQHFADPSQRKSSHFAVSKTGTIEQYVSIDDTAYGNGWIDRPSWVDLIPQTNPNLYTISIEHEGVEADLWTSAEVEAEVKLLRWIALETKLVYVPGRTLIGHHEITFSTPCPGPWVPYNVLATGANGTPVHSPLELALVAAAKKQFELPIDPTHALMKAAQATTHHFPKSDEYIVTQDGIDYVARTFTDGFTDWVFYCKVGDYGNVRWVAKF